MNDREAADLLSEQLSALRLLPYCDLAALVGQPQVTALQGAAGAKYQVEVEVHWDDRPGGAVRVIGSIDAGGWRAIKPLTQDFILAPDGTFVGE